jgi:hypothetical protein
LHIIRAKTRENDLHPELGPRQLLLKLAQALLGDGRELGLDVGGAAGAAVRFLRIGGAFDLMQRCA